MVRFGYLREIMQIKFLHVFFIGWNGNNIQIFVLYFLNDFEWIFYVFGNYSNFVIFGILKKFMEFWYLVFGKKKMGSFSCNFF